MKIMQTRVLTLAALASVMGFNAVANELDPVLPAEVPAALIVRESADGQSQEVFTADANAAAVADEDAARQAIATFVKPENQVKKIANSSELDQVSSDESWHRWYSSYYRTSCYTYSYRSYWPSYGYRTSYYSYYPRYSTWYGGYSYSYYYPRYSYGWGW